MPLPGTADPADLPEEMIVIDENGLTTDQMKLVELARESLSIKFGYTLDEISFFSITPIDWPDASLGCTQPGMDYAQVITPGYQILFQAGLTAYTFHTDTNDRVVLCLEKAPDDIFIQP